MVKCTQMIGGIVQKGHSFPEEVGKASFLYVTMSETPAHVFSILGSLLDIVCCLLLLRYLWENRKLHKRIEDLESKLEEKERK